MGLLSNYICVQLNSTQTILSCIKDSSKIFEQVLQDNNILQSNNQFNLQTLDWSPIRKAINCLQEDYDIADVIVIIPDIKNGSTYDLKKIDKEIQHTSESILYVSSGLQDNLKYFSICDSTLIKILNSFGYEITTRYLIKAYYLSNNFTTAIIDFTYEKFAISYLNEGQNLTYIEDINFTPKHIVDREIRYYSKKGWSVDQVTQYIRQTEELSKSTSVALNNVLTNFDTKFPEHVETFLVFSEFIKVDWKTFLNTEQIYTFDISLYMVDTCVYKQEVKVITRILTAACCIITLFTILTFAVLQYLTSTTQQGILASASASNLTNESMEDKNNPKGVEGSSSSGKSTADYYKDAIASLKDYHLVAQKSYIYTENNQKQLIMYFSKDADLKGYIERLNKLGYKCNLDTSFEYNQHLSILAK